MEMFKEFTVKSVDTELGIVIGWAIVSTVDGQPYYDLQKDHIPEASMFVAAADFMANSAMAKEGHSGEAVGEFIFALPLTSDVAKALEIETKKTGLVVGFKPPKEMLDKFKSGELTGFSIGGERLEDEDVEEEPKEETEEDK